MLRTLFVVLIVSLGFSVSAQSKNLHQYYGGSWNCGYISLSSAELVQKYNACKACEVKGQEYDDNGFCVPKSGGQQEPQQASPPTQNSPAYVPTYIPSPQRRVMWGATACATWNDSNGRARVAVGFAGNFATANEASNAAMAECQKGGGVGCRVSGTFTGCGHITTGKNGSRVGCYTGSTAQDTLQFCYSKGMSQCKQPIGTCLNR